jgi:hypothetical protein
VTSGLDSAASDIAGNGGGGNESSTSVVHAAKPNAIETSAKILIARDYRNRRAGTRSCTRVRELDPGDRDVTTRLREVAALLPALPLRAHGELQCGPPVEVVSPHC